MVQPDPMEPVCRDPQDDKFLATAIAGEASHLVSEDADLLVLNRYRSVAIVNAASFLVRLDEQSNRPG